MFNRPQVPTMIPVTHRADTKAWTIRVWVSFGLAATLCGIGLAYLPGADLDRAFMVMGYGFCLSTAFVLAKHVRDRQGGRADAPMWGAVVWGGFGLAKTLRDAHEALVDAARREGYGLAVPGESE